MPSARDRMIMQCYASSLKQIPGIPSRRSEVRSASLQRAGWRFRAGLDLGICGA